MAKNYFQIYFFILVSLLSSARADTPYSLSELNALQSENEGKIKDLRNQEITQLKIALGRHLPGNRQGQFYLRLAELYLEAYRATFLLEGRAHEKRLQEGKRDQFIDRSQSRPYLIFGLKASQEIIKLHIPFKPLDQVYYFLGFNYGELGKHKESIQAYEILVQKYPQSPFVAEALRELGDSAFDSNQYRNALEYYLLAVTHEKELGNRMARVLHKLAWSYYKTRNFEKAVETMKMSIDRAISGGEKMLSLREEALRDMAIFMTETGRVNEAVKYFEKVADKNYYSMTLEKLARQYERNVEPLKAVQVYESFLRTAPDEESQFKARVKLVDLDLRRGRFQEALGRIEGAPVFLESTEEVRTVSQNLKAMIRRSATEHHERFRKKGSPEDLNIAEKFYSFYLDRFLGRKEFKNEAVEIQMYLADIKKESGKPIEASALYKKIIESQDSRYIKEAAILFLSSLGEAIKKSNLKTGVTHPEEPSALELEFVRAEKDLDATLQNLLEGRESKLKAAQILAGYRKTQKESILIIQKIIEKWPQSAQALTAARLWIQIYADRLSTLQAGEVTESEISNEMITIMKSIRDNAALLAEDQAKGGGKLSQLLAEQDIRFRIGLIAFNEKKQNFAAAAQGYEAFALDSKKAEVAEKALASALSSYLKVSDDPSVLRVAHAWLKRFPETLQGLKSIRYAASFELIQGKFKEAGALFETLGLRGRDANALETAARLSEALGDSLHAQELLSEYLRVYKKSNVRDKIQLQLATSYENTGKESEASKAYEACMKESTALFSYCGIKRADLYLRVKDFSHAKSIFQKIASHSKRNASSTVAYACFRLSEMKEASKVFPPLELPESKLKKSLSARVGFITTLSKSYLSAVEAGGPWGIAALDRLATWVMDFAQEVDHIAPPREATSESSLQFKLSLVKISEPLKKKAKQTWKDAYQNALDSEILSPVLPQIADQLGGVHRAQGVRVPFRLAGHLTRLASEGEAALTRLRSALISNPLHSSLWVDYGNQLLNEGKPLLSKIAYDRAYEIDPKNASALNNQGVLLLQGADLEDWFQSEQAMRHFKEALRLDDLLLPAKINRALLLNYYRLFDKAKPLLEQVSVKTEDAEIQDALGIALFGTGHTEAAKEAFKKATQLGAHPKRFAVLFHQSMEECQSTLEGLETSALEGFEKASVERLKRSCNEWKIKK